MRYDEMRQHVETHFRSVLQKYKDRLLSEGDGSGQRADALRRSLSLVEDDIWLEVALQPDEQGSDLLSQFKARAGVDKLTAEQDDLLLQEYRKGYRSFLTSALEHNANLDQYDLTQPSHSTWRSTEAIQHQGTDSAANGVLNTCFTLVKEAAPC
jgi:hypothetical protein